MANVRIDHIPETVKVTLPLNLIVPDPGRIGTVPVRNRKVLYLLHGLSDDATAWQRFSSIETLANAYGLVVVMPSAGRSFYTDQLNGQRFFTYLTEELPRYLEDLFHLSPRREDTLIAGLSMGGYGAFKTAFAHPERFSSAASLSGVLSLSILNAHPEDPRREEFSYIFGDLSKLEGSVHDPAVWLDRANPGALPRLYIGCGLQDDLYPLSTGFAAACREKGIAAEYHEEPGRHDWFFWDAEIRRFLAFALGPVPSS